MDFRQVLIAELAEDLAAGPDSDKKSYRSTHSALPRRDSLPGPACRAFTMVRERTSRVLVFGALRSNDIPDKPAVPASELCGCIFTCWCCGLATTFFATPKSYPQSGSSCVSKVALFACAAAIVVAESNKPLGASTTTCLEFEQLCTHGLQKTTERFVEIVQAGVDVATRRKLER